MPAKKSVARKSAKAAGNSSAPKAAGEKKPARRRAVKRGKVETIASPARVSSPPARSLDHARLRVGTKEGTVFTLSHSKELQRAAMQWSYVLRNRERWAAQESVRKGQSQRVLELFAELGVGRRKIEELAGAEVVEVSIPFEKEATGWEMRIFPWEYMLTAATKEFRAGRQMIVVRHLDRRAGGGASGQRSQPEKALYVESAPSILAQVFNFKSERALVKMNLDLEEHRELLNPTVKTLKAEVAAFAPDVIHLAGSDNHQAAQLLKSLKGASGVADGYAMAGEESVVELVGAEALAAAVNAAARRPLLVSLNLHNTGARVGSLIVAGGTETAIGFQDEFDDAQTEFFFNTFYHLWRLLGGNTLEAFRITCNRLRAQGSLYGTGVILWSAHSLLQPQGAAAGRRRRSAPAAAPAKADQVEQVLSKEKEKRIAPAEVEPGKASEVLQVNVEIYDTLNYSMLHNNEPLFKKFFIHNPGGYIVCGINVKVVLYAGPMSFPYELTIDLEKEESPLDLGKLIRVPLIYSMGPSISESVHTSLYINVTWGEHDLYRNTHRVTLLPLDEWRDDDNNRIWLPSFVLPRDPSVNRIVDSAQRYLWALADDSGAGFDGYQSVEEEPRTGALLTDGVDLQVQALWAALAFDMNLGYINPPPSYNLSSQRVRTPTEVVEGHRGTCIDLALLLATCCEYIEVYPVIFLLDGHAFPGYWRSDLYHQAFVEMVDPSTLNAGAADQSPTPASAVQRKAWYLSKSFYPEVVKLVHDRKLVPIESTLIARRGSFWEALEAGIENLRSKRQFHSLIDVRLARDNRVTPIPLRWRPE